MKNRTDRGSALSLAVIVVLIVAGIAFAYLGSSFVQARSTGSGIERERAFQTAEAGVAISLGEINAGKDLDSNAIGEAKGSFSSGTYVVTISPAYSGSGQYLLSSIGEHGNGRRGIEVVVQQQTEEAMYPYAMFSNQDFTLSGNVFTDSYNSTLGSYASQAVNVSPDTGETYANAEGGIATNGNIELSGSPVSVFGDVEVGEGMEIKKSGDVYIEGTEGELDEPVDLPLPTYAPTIASAGDFKMDGQKSLTISDGTYRFDTFTMSGQTELTLSGDIEIYVDGQISQSGGAVLTVTPGSKVTIYHGTEGDINISGSGVINQGQIPEAFQVISSNEGSVNFSGSSNFYGTIYAPGAEFKPSGGAEFFGAFISDKITMSGSATFHYDEALGSIGGSTSGDFAVQAWREFTP